MCEYTNRMMVKINLYRKHLIHCKRVLLRLFVCHSFSQCLDIYFVAISSKIKFFFMSVVRWIWIWIASSRIVFEFNYLLFFVCLCKYVCVCTVYGHIRQDYKHHIQSFLPSSQAMGFSTLFSQYFPIFPNATHSPKYKSEFGCMCSQRIVNRS